MNDLATLAALPVGIALALLTPWLVMSGLRSFRRNQFLIVACTLTTAVPAIMVVLSRQGAIATDSVPTLIGYATVAAIGLVVIHAVTTSPQLTSLAWACLGFAAIEVASAVYTQQLAPGIQGFGQVAVLAVGPVLLASLHSCDLSRDTQSRLVALLGGFVCSISLLAWFADPESYTVQTTERIGVSLLEQRFIGVANNPNTFGMIAAATLIAATLWTSRLRWLLVLIAGVALLMTGQRAGLMSAVILVAGLAITLARHAAVRLFVTACGVAIAIPVMQGVLSSPEADSDQSFDDRQEAWRFVSSHLSELWFSGWGPSGLVERTRAAGIGGGLHHAHNEFFTALATGGLPLVVALVLMLLLGARSARANRSTLDRNIVGLLALIPFLVFESPLHTGMNPMNVPQVTFFFLVVATLTSPNTVGAGGSSDDSTQAPPATADSNKRRTTSTAGRQTGVRQTR